MAECGTGITFPVESIGWIDFESSSAINLKHAGVYRYAVDADAIVLAYAIGHGPAQTVSVQSFGTPLHWDRMPMALREHHARVMQGTAIWAAWNAGFDKAIWNYSTLGFPKLEATMLIDVAAQAAAAGLPADLSTASRVGGARKLEIGKSLIKLFSLSGGSPSEHPDEWRQFLDYAARDVEAMRSIFLHTRQLSYAEWCEYWVMETINERGALIDTKMVQAAADMALEDKRRSKAELAALTGDMVRSVDQVAQLNQWLLSVLPAEGRSIMLRRVEEVDADGLVTRPAAYSITRDRIIELIAYVQTLPPGELTDCVLRVLQIRLYGGSKSPAKFRRMLDQSIDGVLRGQYVFNGAGGTGRASSRGVQIHNLTRDALTYEHAAIEALLGGVDYDTFARLGNDAPVSRKLALLVRPTFVAPPGKAFVWSDWSQIEARVLPWLAGEDVGAAHRLDIFRTVDADPSIPDLYTRTASAISNLRVEDITKPLRQRGKVAELALGYGGGVNALQAMGAGYGLHLADAEARVIVERWRAANAWCVHFWGAHDHSRSYGLWGAANRALAAPLTTHTSGRIAYTYLPDYLGGSLICTLPSSRCLTYRAIRYESVEDKDADGAGTGTFTTHLRCSRDRGRIKLWPGLLAENVVQAVAADVLRGTLCRLYTEGCIVILTTHDEIVLEVAEGSMHDALVLLRSVMREGFTWSGGLPLMSEETVSYYYSKDATAYLYYGSQGTLRIPMEASHAR